MKRYMHFLYKLLWCAALLPLPVLAQETRNLYTSESQNEQYTGVSVSSYSGFRNAGRVCDGSSSSYATITSSSSPSLTLDLGSSKSLGKIVITSSSRGWTDYHPTSVTVYGGDASNSCDNIILSTRLSYSSDVATVNLSNAASYQYVRLVFIASNGDHINELSFYGPKQDATIQHKPSKWIDLKNHLGLSDESVGSFNYDEPWFTSVMSNNPDAKLQAAHTYIDTIYVHKGSTVDLALPTKSARQWDGSYSSSVKTYQRWYSYRTDGTFETNHSQGAAYDLLTPQDNLTVYRLSNGYVGRPLSSSQIQDMTFYYPTDDEFNAWFDNASSFDNDWYVVACDVSGYTDFTAEYAGEQDDEDVDDNTLRANFRSNYYEPTLGLRAIYYIVGVDDHKSTASWTKGHYRLKSAEYQGGTTDKKYLEEYEISFPAKHLSNYTSELVALSKDARGYAIPDVQENAGLSIKLANDNAGLQLETTSLSGENRVIQFRKKGVGRNTPWEVADGSSATILVTKIVNGITYNIARFKLTFHDDQLPLTQTQVSQLGTSDANGKSWNHIYRSPQWMKDNLKLLTSQNFDYDPTVAAEYGQDEYFPFPLSWSNSSYAFFDGSKKGDYNGATNINGQYYAEWGNYAIVNNYMGYGDIINNGTQISGTPPKGVGKDDDGYFLFIDASDRPGVLAQLPFDERLCPGSELFMTAWMKSAGIRDNDDAALLFTVLGVKNNADGTVTRTPIYRHSSSQIRATAWLNSSDPGTGPGHNEWYQIYFSFINNDAQAANYDSYVLQVENNSASTNGGDMYLDDIRVYLMQPSAEVAQLEASCTDKRTLMNINLDWDRLMSRLGYTDEDQGVDAIDFCFIDEAVYNAYLLQHPGDYSGAISNAVVEVGNNETGEGGYNGTFNTLYFKLPFDQNTVYDENKHPNLAVNNKGEDGNYYFYRMTDDAGTRSLVVDFYSALTPNRPYIMLIQPHVSSDPTLDADDFASDINDVCAIKTTFYVTTQTLLRVNGEVVDPSTDFCAGQIFNFSANMRVPTGVNPDGTNIYTEIKDGVYFDWFFGSEDEYLAPNPTYGGVSLMDALVTFRDIYPDNTDLTGVKTGPQTSVDGQEMDFKQDYYDIIKYYMEAEGTEGGVHNRLVLHRENMDITLLSSGLKLVIQPIPTVESPDGTISDEDWAKVCWSYVPLELDASGDAPQLHAGFNSTKYPSSDFNPGLRIGLSQIKATSADKPMTIDLRGAVLVSPNATYIGLVKSVTPQVFNKIYLVDTDDPAYKNATFFPVDFSEYSLPIGVIKSLHAEPYGEGSSYEDEMQIYFDTTTEQENGFRFQPKEGYTYTFAVHFEEQGGTESSNTCFGSFVVPMKVVPENLVWRGTSATSNWNNDANWARADKDELKKDGSDSYLTNDENTTSQGFVPMLFTNVVMPKDSKAELYMAGYTNGGEGWTSGRPDYMELPTENIQYDLMAYEKDNALTTQRYRVNICRDIHFEPGAQMLHAEDLLYNKAWTDVEVAPGQWTLVSTPLQGVVAGDWYAPTATGQQATEYFKDITFADGVYNRLNPAIYQRSWSDGATIVEQGGTNNTPVSFTTEWSSVYNDASVPYSAGAGFSLKAIASGQTTPLLFRFPKADNSYNVSTTSLNRGNAGKLLVSEMVDRSDPYTYKDPTNVTVALKPSPAKDGARYLMVGNPFMTSLDVRKFVEANEDVLAQKYWYVKVDETTGNESTQADALGDNGNWTAATAYQAAPYSAFYVEAAAPNAADVEVQFTADMQVAFTQASGTASASQARALQIEAADSHGSSQALLSYSAQADNACASEDAVLLSNLSGNATAAPQVYTVAGNTAVSVNWLKDAQQIPLGVFAATEDDEVTLTFTGLGALRSPRLYDAELNTETLLSEGYQLTVKGSSHGRYFLRSLGGALTGLTPTTTDPELTVYSVRPGELIVSSNATLQSVQVFTADGRRLSPAVQSQSNCVWRLSGVDKGVVLIKATAGNRQQVVRKAMVK